MTQEEMQDKISKEKTGVLQLSIVMITIPERKKEFSKLRRKLSTQINYVHEVHPTLGDVEIVSVITPRYPQGPSIGGKRQQGLERAKGTYVCWLDDDDDIAPDYVETLLRLAYNGTDVLTFSNLSRFDSFWCVVNMSLYNPLDEQVRPGIVNRRPYHVCAWRRELTKQVTFPDLNKDEDTGFIEKLIPLCKTESHSNNILHEYKRITKSYAIDAYTKDENG